LIETADTVRTFWFGSDDGDDAAIGSRQGKLWWSKDDNTDREIRTRFEACTIAASGGRFDQWSRTPHGLLALILLTDQFPRNMYRNRPESFSFDPIALHWALDGLARGADALLRPIERVFFYLPLEHAESLPLQERVVGLFKKLQDDVPAEQHEAFAGYTNFAIRHRDIIARFGRFPHRNAILGRASTDEESAFLKTPGSGF